MIQKGGAASRLRATQGRRLIYPLQSLWSSSRSMSVSSYQNIVAPRLFLRVLPAIIRRRPRLLTRCNFLRRGIAPTFREQSPGQFGQRHRLLRGRHPSQQHLYRGHCHNSPLLS